ncbi:MAG: hypothetical protein AAGK01_06405 [Pseudomonadota bacterium]
MITVSDGLYASYQETDFYHFLFAFLRENARDGTAFRAAFQDERRCRSLWTPFFDPERDKMDLALRHAYVLGCHVAGEPVGSEIPADLTPMDMKARLDSWDFIPFAAFTRRGD